MTPEEREQIRAKAAELEADRAAERARLARLGAAALAVEALKPLAGAYRNVNEYGVDIISVAGQLGDWIRDGGERP